jgi:hypothetical protein
MQKPQHSASEHGNCAAAKPTFKKNFGFACVPANSPERNSVGSIILSSTSAASKGS